MKHSKGLLSRIGRVWHKLNPLSLQMRLTVGIAAFSAIGLSSAALWTSWKMQQIVVSSQKETILYLANRFSQDVEIYSDMVPVEQGIQRAIDNITTGDTLLWVRHPGGAIAYQSDALAVEANRNLLTAPQQLAPQVRWVSGRYWAICGALVRVEGMRLGTVYVARDITEAQAMFFGLTRTMGIASFIAIVILTVAIALYIRRSLQPLRQISQLTRTISAEDLGRAQLHLERAPSEVKELAQTFDNMLLRLCESWEQQRQFVSNVSHELRTPLTIVSGYLQSTLRRSGNLTEPQQEALEIATAEANRTIQLLQDLLDLARADSGRMHFNLEKVVLNELVAETIAMATQYSNRTISLEATDRNITAKCDRDRLKQVLLNLIDNAVKYSEPDRPVTVKLSRQRQQATIEVCDKGCGIPLQQQARLFERFYRVDEARARSTGGYGLGLSIVKTLVEGMGGSVTVRSKLGEGSVFTVTLPAQA